MRKAFMYVAVLLLCIVVASVAFFTGTQFSSNSDKAKGAAFIISPYLPYVSNGNAYLYFDNINGSTPVYANPPAGTQTPRILNCTKLMNFEWDANISLHADQQVSVVLVNDPKITPIIMEKYENAQHFLYGEIIAFLPNDPSHYLIISLQDCVITSFNISGNYVNADSGSLVGITLGFVRATVNFVSPDGSIPFKQSLMAPSR